MWAPSFCFPSPLASAPTSRHQDPHSFYQPNSSKPFPHLSPCRHWPGSGAGDCLFCFRNCSLCVHSSSLHLSFSPWGQACQLMSLFSERTLKSPVCLSHNCQDLGRGSLIPPNLMKPQFSLTSCLAWSQSSLLYRMLYLLFTLWPVATLWLLLTLFPSAWKMFISPNLSHLTHFNMSRYNSDLHPPTLRTSQEAGAASFLFIHCTHRASTLPTHTHTHTHTHSHSVVSNSLWPHGL